MRDLSHTVGKRVVRLPTAAPKQVRQFANRETRAAKATMRESQSRDFDYTFPSIRAAEAEAELVMGAQRSPALALAIAMFQALPDGQRERAKAFLDLLALTDTEARHAAALVKARTIGEQHDLHRAMDRLGAPRSTATTTGE